MRRYYIAFQVKPYTDNPLVGRGGRLRRRTRYVWPILFETEEAAWKHMRDVQLFRNGGDKRRSGAIPGKRIVSASVESTLVRQ